MKAARPHAISGTGRTASHADRRRAVSAARRALARAAVVERGIRPVEVSRYLGVSRAAVTAQLRAHDT